MCIISSTVANTLDKQRAMSDEDLPSIAIISKTSEDFCMPAADVLASQRAREEECKQELQELGSQFENIDNVSSPVVHLVRQDSNSSSSDSEASLTAAVKALHMEQLVFHSAPAPSTMLHALISTTVLRPYDLTLLKKCLLLLDTNDEKFIENTLHRMISDIRQWIRKANHSDSLLQVEDTVVVCCWLFVVSLWSGPQPGGMRVVLMELLKRAEPTLEETVAAAISEALPEPHMLVKASDIVFGPLPAQRHLSDRLLTAALDVLVMPDDPTPVSTLSLTFVCKRIKCAWCGLDSERQLTALMLAGRIAARTEVDPSSLEALQEVLVRVMQAPAQPLSRAPEYLQIPVAASKLQILFEVNKCVDDNIN